MPREEEKLVLGKGAAFLKSPLKRLRQGDETWEADFRALPKPKPSWSPISMWPSRTHWAMAGNSFSTLCCSAVGLTMPARWASRLVRK